MLIPLHAKPKKKDAYPCITLEENIYISGFGKINKYEDPDGVVKYLVDLMDGSRTVSEIATIMSDKFDGISYDMVIEAINDFSEDGFLEDTALIGSELLNAYQLQRYHRNINFFSTYTSINTNKYLFQKKLCDAKVCLIGLGGLGSHILYDLAGLGIGNIRAIEFDSVDLSNLNRQILYNENDIGKKKADLAKERIRQFNPSIKLETWATRINSTEDAYKAVLGYDYVILVADRPKTKITLWVNEACVKAKVPMINGGLEAQRAMHYTVLPNTTGCVECWVSKVKKQDPVSFALLEERRRLNLTGDNTAIVPLVSTLTGMMVAELVRLITNVKSSVAAGKLVTIDFDTMTTNVAETWERDPDCSICKDH